MIKRFILGCWHFLKALVYDDVEWSKQGYGAETKQWSSKFIAKVRGVIMLTGAGATAFSKEIITTGALPHHWEPKIKAAGVVVAAMAVMLRAGDKTPPAVVAMAKRAASDPVLPAVEDPK